MSELRSRLADTASSAARQVISVAMLLFGSLLALNAAVGPCGGTALAVEPFPAILVSIFGLALMVFSYYPIKSLKVESDFRVVIYLFLLLWSMSLLLLAVGLARSGLPVAREDINDLHFSLFRGIAAIASLVLFYRWAGVKNLITGFW